MKPLQFITLLLITGLTYSCKKENNSYVPVLPNLNINYQTINRSVKASDVNSLTIDVNKDGVIDYSFFLQLAADSKGDHLYAGVNPVYGSFVKANAPNDDRFLNMGNVIAFAQGVKLKENDQQGQLWTEDHSVLAIRHTYTDGISYECDWGTGTAKILAIKLTAKGETYYGWIRLVFNKTNENLTVVDLAWNTVPNQEIKAGEGL